MLMKPVSKNFIFIFHSLFLQNDRLTKNMEAHHLSPRELCCAIMELQQENAKLKQLLAVTQQMVEDLQNQLAESRWRCYYLEHQHSTNIHAEDILLHPIGEQEIVADDNSIHVSTEDLSKLCATL